MAEKDNANNKVGFESMLLGNIKHSATVIVCNNRLELLYVLEWCKLKDKKVSNHMWNNYKFPYCLSVNGNIVGWTDLMDRALYYKSFNEFVSNVA